MLVHGIVGGSTTLFWCLVLFSGIILVVAMINRELYGRRPVAGVDEFFDSVPRSILTTFRCALADCTNTRGEPIFEAVHKEYGWGASSFHICFVSLSVAQHVLWSLGLLET